jgi:solute carrier family 25 (adenine nucleotide translocator) protein 4/5/6/31
MQTMPELIKQGVLSKPYTNVIDCAKRVTIEEGKTAFWKGNISNLLKFYPAEALNWIFKELFQSTFRNFISQSEDNLRLNFIVNYLGGASAGLMTRSLLYPFEFTRNKMNNDIQRKNGGIWNCLTDAYKKGGLRAIYQGALISFMGVAIFRSTYFGIYDTFK